MTLVWTRNPWDLRDSLGRKVGVVESQVTSSLPSIDVTVHAREIVARALSKKADYFGADVILLDGFARPQEARFHSIQWRDKRTKLNWTMHPDVTRVILSNTLGRWKR
ncbi:hypothetical protein BKA82DRAFT_4342505 [Pisolithus tinctorius]|nr:hypothetical protein BKA82DRAFT_4342505 [Pisolithus tinctorius]